MPQQAVAHLNGLVATVDADMDMESEDDQAACDVLHRVHEPLVAFTWGKALIRPVAPGMRATPEEGQPIAAATS